VTQPDNARLAERLDALASLLDLSGASFYSVRAYRRAAELIRSTPADVTALVRAGRVRELSGIGGSIEAKLHELVETGRIAELDELEATVRPELVGLARLVGLSPARLVEIGTTLDVSNADELREAAATKRLREIRGIGPATEAKVLAALDRPRLEPRRGLTLNRALELTGTIADRLGGIAAGDARRFRDLSHQLAVVVGSDDAEATIARFAALAEVVSIAERGTHRALGVIVDGVPIELVVASNHELGTALMRATGSNAYVAALGELPAAPDEHGVYAALGVPFLHPELREEPYAGAAPALVERAAIRGDLHVHTTWSDGRASVLEMAEAAIALGYEYLAICDHTRSVRVVPGLDADDVRRQGEEIAAANDQLAPFRVLRGIECDILPDGSLDLPDEILDELDWVQASVHAGQRQSREQLTQRTLAAAEHPAVRSISHPQGRILNHRPPNAVDLDAVYSACVATGTALETNGLPDRIDLSAEHVRDAVRAGVVITCSTDAHSVQGLQNMRLSVATARRGWCTAADVLNTRPLEEIL
jgi:DNA polymerase (family 10)